MKLNQRIAKQRQNRRWRVRNRIRETTGRVRLTVFRSNKHIYAQVISDTQGKTLAAVSTLAGELADSAEKSKGVEVAKQVGLALAKVCKQKNISKVIFDRNGFLFHGRVKALADGAREGGLEF